MTENALGASPATAEEPTQATEVTDVQPGVTEGAEPAPAKVEPKEDPIQKRFDKLTKEKYDAQRRADRLEWELEQARKQPAKPEPVAPELPTLEGSGFDDGKYQAALVEYTKATAKAEVARILKEEREQQQQVAKASEFDNRQADFAKSNPDYAEKVIEGGRRGEWSCTAEMADVIRESDMGPQIAYHLAENPELAASIAKLSPLAQAREIGRIEARLDQKASPTPKVSSAPPPPPKLDAADGTVSPKTTDPSGDSLSDDEWVKAERKRIAKRR